jgi:hypothetical protein
VRRSYGLPIIKIARAVRVARFVTQAMQLLDHGSRLVERGRAEMAIVPTAPESLPVDLSTSVPARV